MNENYTFFWKNQFSQWYMRDFTDNLTNIRYNCCEQYMMWGKALQFRDYEMAEQILKSDNPKHQKAMGRKVKNFVEGDWNKVARNIVYDGNLYKFTQHKDLKELLVATKGTELVEANPYDKIWSCGLTASNAKKTPQADWPGKNWLGQVLTKVRDDIIKNGW
jgi:ribA/ribD-fused uncharacterized protein